MRHKRNKKPVTDKLSVTDVTDKSVTVVTDNVTDNSLEYRLEVLEECFDLLAERVKKLEERGIIKTKEDAIRAVGVEARVKKYAVQSNSKLPFCIKHRCYKNTCGCV